MPITSKKQSKAKNDWMAKNSKVYGVRVMINTEHEIYDFLQSQSVPAATVIKEAIKEYMKNHPVQQTFLYGMRSRGCSPGAQPKGFIERRDDPSGKYHDIIVYDHPLTGKECEEYELDHIYPAD